MWEYLLTIRPGIGWVNGTASVTGVVLQVLICLMVVCSSTFVRRSGHFEVMAVIRLFRVFNVYNKLSESLKMKWTVFVQVFYWSHLSYIWVWALLVVHCANFWKWFVVPGVVFLIEKVVGIAVSRIGGLYIVEVNLLPSKVLYEMIQKLVFLICYIISIYARCTLI